jgi:hypothetical protein
MLTFSLLAGLTLSPLAAPPDKASEQAKEQMKEVAGSAEFLRSVPKHFATLKGMDRAHQRVTLLMEDETQAREWPLVPDAEIKIQGWWGRLDQFALGDRVWVWLQLDRVKQPLAVSMLADEVSEQDMHGEGAVLAARDDTSITIKTAGEKARVLKTKGAEVFQGAAPSKLPNFKTGEKVFVQSAGDGARLILDMAAFEARRKAQKEMLRKRWIDEGLPGTVAFLHQFSGELDYMLDHEAMRWGRSLKAGDKVFLQGSPAIPAVVKHVRPWRERTEVRLVTSGADQSDLSVGQRVKLKMTAPSQAVEDSPLPPDLDQPRTKEERVEWFLASIYCTCKIGEDTCTGMFYTLASCNPNGCGMPNHMRQVFKEKIDKGLTDKQIFEEQLKADGTKLIRPHLEP